MRASSSPAVSAAAAAEEARRALEAGDLERALALAERLVEGATSCLPAHGLVAIVLLRLGRLEEMRRAIAQAAGLGSGIPDAYDGLGFVAVAAGDLEFASRLYGRAIELAPQEPRLHIILAFPPLRKLGILIGEDSFLEMNDEVDGWTRRDEIFAKTQERLKSRDSAAWLELFAANDIWAGPVYGYADLVDDPQIQHNGTFVEYEHETEGSTRQRGR